MWADKETFNYGYGLALKSDGTYRLSDANQDFGCGNPVANEIQLVDSRTEPRRIAHGDEFHIDKIASGSLSYDRRTIEFIATAKVGATTVSL